MFVSRLDGPKIRKRRKELNFSQQEIERTFGVPRSTLAEIELGHTQKAEKRTLEKLAAALGWKEDDLFVTPQNKSVDPLRELLQEYPALELRVDSLVETQPEEVLKAFFNLARDDKLTLEHFTSDEERSRSQLTNQATLLEYLGEQDPDTTLVVLASFIRKLFDQLAEGWLTLSFIKLVAQYPEAFRDSTHFDLFAAVCSAGILFSVTTLHNLMEPLRDENGVPSLFIIARAYPQLFQPRGKVELRRSIKKDQELLKDEVEKLERLHTSLLKEISRIEEDGFYIVLKRELLSIDELSASYDLVLRILNTYNSGRQESKATLLLYRIVRTHGIFQIIERVLKQSSYERYVQ